jgi:hypothetical protein
MPAASREITVSTFVSYLNGRLKVIADRKRYPEISKVTIRNPLIVIGPPRSGSTLLHTLLSLDPDHIFAPFWVCMEPSPPPALGEPMPERIDAASRQMSKFFGLIPDVYLTHPYMIEEGSGALAECGTDILSMAFTNQGFWCYYGVDGYRDYLLNGDHTAALSFHHDFLQHLQWGREDKRWALKAADHLVWLGYLHAQYPDANFIWTHRDLSQLLGSLASVVNILRGIAGPVDAGARRRLGQEIIDFEHKVIMNGMRVRDAVGEDRFCDVSYHDMMANPVLTIERIYGRFGLKLSEKAAANIGEWLAQNPQTKHGVHRHSPEEFGLDAEVVNRQFAKYRERFGFGFGIRPPLLV